MLSRDCLEAARVTVALIAWETELASPRDEPAVSAFARGIDHEPNGSSVAGCRPSGLRVVEVRFEISVYETILVGSVRSGVVVPTHAHQRRESRRRNRSTVHAPRAHTPTAHPTMNTMIPVNSSPNRSEAPLPAEHLSGEVRLDLQGGEDLRLWHVEGSTLHGRAPMHELAPRLGQ